MLSITTKKGRRGGQLQAVPRDRSLVPRLAGSSQGDRALCSDSWRLIQTDTDDSFRPTPRLAAWGRPSVQSPLSFQLEEPHSGPKALWGRVRAPGGDFVLGNPRGALGAECWDFLVSLGAFLLPLGQVLSPRHTQRPRTARFLLPPLSDPEDLLPYPPQATLHAGPWAGAPLPPLLGPPAPQDAVLAFLFIPSTATSATQGSYPCPQACWICLSPHPGCLLAP